MKREHKPQRRTFLVKLASLAVAGVSLGSVVNRFGLRNKPLTPRVEDALYPTINPMAIPRKQQDERRA